MKPCWAAVLSAFLLLAAVFGSHVVEANIAGMEEGGGAALEGSGQVASEEGTPPNLPSATVEQPPTAIVDRVAEGIFHGDTLHREVPVAVDAEATAGGPAGEPAGAPGSAPAAAEQLVAEPQADTAAHVATPDPTVEADAAGQIAAEAAGSGVPSAGAVGASTLPVVEQAPATEPLRLEQEQLLEPAAAAAAPMPAAQRDPVQGQAQAALGAEQQPSQPELQQPEQQAGSQDRQGAVQQQQGQPDAQEHPPPQQQLADQAVAAVELAEVLEGEAAVKNATFEREESAEDAEALHRREEEEEEEEAERAAAAVRQRRLREAEAEVERAELLVGWALDEDGVDVPLGIQLLQALFARLDAHIDAALGESVSRRRLFTPSSPQEPVEAVDRQPSHAEAGTGTTESDSAAATSSAPSTAATASESGSDTQASSGSSGEVFSATSAVAAGEAAPLSADTAAADATASDTAGAVFNSTEPLPPPPSYSLDRAEHPELLPLADAAFTLAALLSSGLAAGYGLPRNETAAIYALHRAALAGCVEARLALAERYSTGRGLPLMMEEGMGHAKVAGPHLLALLDETGNINSEGGGHLRRKWMDSSYLPASNIWEDANTLHMEMDAAARGDVEARRQLGFRMLMGQGMQRDLAAAYREFQAAAAGGDPYAMFNMGFMHIRGMHVEQNYTLAYKHFLDAADKKLPAASNGLGVLYFHGQGVPVNMSEAFRYFQAASLQDHDAAYNLGTMYQGAYSVERNMTTAIELFNNATALGSWRAPHQLFMVYADGLYGIPRNYNLALNSFWHFLSMTGAWKEGGKEAADRAAEHDAWGAAVRYSLLAEQGNSLARLNLAWLLHRGVAYTGADRHRLALSLWLRAAAHNQTEGMLMAGHVLWEGHKWGLEGGANVTRAVQLYQQAAAAGSIEGLYTMGRLREQGLGVERNVSEAMRLYRQAVQTAPFECYAMAPFLALWWLRLRLLLGPLLRLLTDCLAPLMPPTHGSNATTRLAAGVAARAGGGGVAAQLHRRAPRLPMAQWDTLLIAVMAGVLTWVLWRKRQLSQQRSSPPPPPPAATPSQEPPSTAEPLAAAEPHQPGSPKVVPDSGPHLAAGPALSASGLRQRGASSAAGSTGN